MAQQAGDLAPGGVPVQPPMSVRRRRDGRKILIASLSVAVMVLVLAVLGLTGATAFLWFSRGGGGISSASTRPISLPGQLGDFGTASTDDQVYDADQSAAMLQQAYHAAAALQEYVSGSAKNRIRLVVTAVRTRLSWLPSELTRNDKNSDYAYRVEVVGADTWCVINDKLNTGSHCWKAAGALSVEVSQLGVEPLRTADLAALTRVVFEQID